MSPRPKMPGNPIDRAAAFAAARAPVMPPTTPAAPDATAPAEPTATMAAAAAAPRIAQPLAPSFVDRRLSWKDVFVDKAFLAPRIHVDLQKRLPADLRALLDAPPTLGSRATHELDGRKDRLVLVVARDAAGEPARGVLVRLLEDAQLRDHARTDARGIALLSDPHAHGGQHDRPGALVVEVLRGGADPIRRPVAIPHGKQHQVMEIVLDPLPAAPSEVPILDDGGGSSAASRERRALSQAMSLTGLDLVDNPLDRLPTDFSTELCQDVRNILGPTEDPIFNQVEGASADFRRRRVPLVKRMTIPRTGQPQAGKPPRRYLVRVRQEWTFLGYTLGELAEVEALDPGAVLNEATRTVERAVQSATRAVDSLHAMVNESTRSGLHSEASVENVLHVANSVRTHAVAGGFGLFLGPLALGAVGASAGVSTTSAVRSRTDTSLEVNASLHVAKSAVNRAQRTLQSTRRDVQRAVSTAVNQVSPLLSRVTNLMRWTLYENYMVCTNVEDVVEVVDVQIADLGSPTTNLFTDEQIVDLRRVFEPGLLERSLRPHFDTLAAAVNARRGAELPIVAVHVTVDYSPGMGGATLNARIGSDEATFHLRPGTSRASQTIRLAAPMDDSAFTAMELDLVLGPTVTLFGGITIPNSASVARVEIAYQTASGFIRRQSVALGDALRVDQDDRTATTPVTLTVPPPAVFTQHDPLVVHVNSNRTYYFGLLCQAALLEPSLRDDLPHFGAFDGSHELWRLPIVGFEGNRALVVKDADQALAEVQDLLRDPGAATLIQLAAPGAYAEALQGLLKLAVDTEKIHPSLIPAPAPVMPPLALVDVTGRTIPVIGGDGTTGGVVDGATGTVGGATGGTGTGGTGTGGTGGLTTPTLPTP